MDFSIFKPTERMKNNVSENVFMTDKQSCQKGLLNCFTAHKDKEKQMNRQAQRKRKRQRQAQGRE